MSTVLTFVSGKSLNTRSGPPANRNGFAPAKLNPSLMYAGESVTGSILPNGEGSPARLAGISGVGTPDAPMPSLSALPNLPPEGVQNP